MPEVDRRGPGLLGGLPNLETLTLIGLPMTKAGLDHVRKLPKLKTLNISRGQLDDSTLDEFEDARPGVMVNLFP